MAETQETIILNVEIDQADAQKQLIATEKSINSLRKESEALRKEYKDGKISEDQYIQSNLKLQEALKKETAQKSTLNKLLNTESGSRDALRVKIGQLNKEYNSINQSTAEGQKRAKALAAELKNLNKQLNKGSQDAGQFKDNIGNYTSALQGLQVPVGNQIKQVKDYIAGIGDATKGLGLFGAAAVGTTAVVAALGAAYAASAEGARDLQRTQDLLAATTSILANAVGDFVGTTEEGQGLFSTFLQTALLMFDAQLGATAIAKANAADLLRQLEISEAFAQAAAKDSERRAENARRIRDDESKDLQERLDQTKVIEAELSASAQRSIVVLNARKQAIIDSTTGYEKSREAQLQVAQIDAEIADKEEEINGKLTENVTARRNIAKLIKEAAELEAGVAAANKRINTGPGVFSPVDKRSVSQAVLDAKSTADLGVEGQALIEQQTQENIAKAMADGFQVQLNLTEKFNADLNKFNSDARKQDVEDKKRSVALKKELDHEQEMADLAALDAYASIVASAGQLYGQQSAGYKILASASTLISTYTAAQKQFEALSEFPPLAYAAAAAAIAQGLANVAAINGVQFAEGGWTGPGSKYTVAGVVHADEYVVPKNINNSAAAQPHIKALETMRTRGYADGGFVTNETISASQQALIFTNALRNLPPAELSVKEVTTIQNRIAARENISRL